MPGDRSSSTVLLWIDEPEENAASAGALHVAGWAFRRGGHGAVRVEACLGERRLELPLDLPRPDVAAELGEPLAEWSGFAGTIPVETGPTSRADKLVVRAVGDSGERVEVEVAVRLLPADVPVLEPERARLRGDRVEVEGWLVWPESAPPRRVALLLGGERIAEDDRALSRPDVARRFPAAPAASCRGFRLAAWVPASDVPDGRSAEIEIVATDREGRRLSAAVEVTRDEDSGRAPAARAKAVELEREVSRAARELGREPVVLDWRSGLPLGELRCPVTVVSPPAPDETELPYLERSLDIVATDDDPARVAAARRVAAWATIEAGNWRDRKRPRRRAVPTFRDVSIVVPLPAESDTLAPWLAKLRESLPTTFDGEVLIVASDTEARAADTRPPSDWPAVRRLAGARKGFAAAANRAAALARGERVVFLEAGSRPRSDWLPPLLRTLDEAPHAGAVCGKRLEADGTLRDAGLTRRGEAGFVRRGAGDDRPGRPELEHVRAVEAGSAALLAVRRATLLELGGIDEGLVGADEFGLELSLRLGAAGRKVFYQPASVVVGAEESAVVRAVDAKASVSRPPVARRSLVAAPGLPEFDRESGSRRVWHLIESLQRDGWEVSCLARKASGGERYLRLLQQRGVAVFSGPASIGAGDEYVDDLGQLIAEGGFEIAILSFWSVAEELLPLFRERSPRTRLLVDSVDLHFVREERAALASASPELEGDRVRRLDRRRRELRAYGAADAVLTVSEDEAERVARELGGAVPAICVPDLEEMPPSARGFGERTALLFLGNFHHAPNLEALEYFCAEIAPRLSPGLLAALPLTVVGNGVDRRVHAAAASVPHARVVGWVPAVEPYLEAARVSLAPLRHGAGTKRKLVQALMAGTPTVSTSIGVEGLDLEHGRHVLVADTPLEFAAAVERLATDSSLWSLLAREGRRKVSAAHGRSAVEARLAAAIARSAGAAAVRAEDPRHAGRRGHLVAASPRHE